MAGGDVENVEVAPGKAAEATLILKPALYFSGVVVDERGKPIPMVEVASDLVTTRSSAGIERTTSRPDGSFELFCYPVTAARRGRWQGSTSRSSIPIMSMSKLKMFTRLHRKIANVLRIILPTGHK